MMPLICILLRTNPNCFPRNNLIYEWRVLQKNLNLKKIGEKCQMPNLMSIGKQGVRKNNILLTYFI